MQPVTCLFGDVVPAVQLTALPLQLLALRLDLRILRLKLVDLPALRDVLPHRVRQAKGDAAEHDRHESRAASEVRLAIRRPASPRSPGR